MQEKLTSSLEDYLEVICNYLNENKTVRAIDISKKLNVSTNTIRKALMNIADDGYITFGRGRYGGTVVVDKPLTNERQQYQWLSINPDYI